MARGPEQDKRILDFVKDKGMKPEDIYILVGCEESQAVTIAFRERRFKAFSCDIQDCSGGHPEWHIKGDVFEAINSRKWNAGIFFPDCTYLTCSAEWAYAEPPHHQKTKPGTLVGIARINARLAAVDFFKRLYYCNITSVMIENPKGVISSIFRKPDQIIQPWYFGDDASKSTCLWLRNLPKLTYNKKEQCTPRLVTKSNGDFVYRWSNQTDSGQNKLPPSKDRAKLRSKTYPGIAKALATQYGDYLLRNI